MTIQDFFGLPSVGPLGDDIPVRQNVEDNNFDKPGGLESVTINDETEVAEGEFLRARYGLKAYQMGDITDLLRFAQEFSLAQDNLEPLDDVLARRDERTAKRAQVHQSRLLELLDNDLYTSLAEIFGPGVQISDGITAFSSQHVS